MIKRLQRWILGWRFVKNELDGRVSDTYWKLYPTIMENEKYLKFQLDKERADIMIAAQKDLRLTMIDDTEARAKEIANEKLAAMLSIFDPKHIVTFSERTRQVYIGGEIADAARLGNLKAEAQMITDTNLWQILHETPKKLAQKALFEDDGDSKVVHTKGRAMLYLLSTQENIMSVFLNYNPQTPPK